MGVCVIQRASVAFGASAIDSLLISLSSPIWSLLFAFNHAAF